ncbi:hypothetical protein O3P69_013700 [Scylla paramamosain]|uniref:Uncharacterized protein n=1 Tax=Scylla paramamosain TaxID=85552 RepID=A0AAW0SR54_SCYPA
MGDDPGNSVTGGEEASEYWFTPLRTRHHPPSARHLRPQANARRCRRHIALSDTRPPHLIFIPWLLHLIITPCCPSGSLKRREAAAW